MDVVITLDEVKLTSSTGLEIPVSVNGFNELGDVAVLAISGGVTSWNGQSGDITYVPDIATANIQNGAVTEEKLDEDVVDAIYASYPTDEASGSIASFPDGADGIAVKDLTIGIEPVQDLHGQSNPYPSGGGKNLFNSQGLISYSNNGITITESNGTLTLNGTAGTGNAYFSVNGIGATSTTGFTWSANNSATNSNVHISLRTSNYTYFLDGNLGAANRTNGNSTATDCDGLTIYIISGTTLTNFAIKPQLEVGSTATAYAPYSNICPISGWTGANLTRTGFNVWDEVWEVGSLTTAGGDGTATDRIRSKNYIPVLPNTVYYRNAPNNYQPFYYDADKNFISYGLWGTGNITTPSNARYIRFQVDPAYGTTYNHDISINYPSTDHTYHAYEGDNYAIDWSSHGTIYGGTLDVTTGVLTVDRAYKAFTSADADAIGVNHYSPIWRLNWNGASSTAKAPTSTTVTNIMSNVFKAVGEAYRGTAWTCFISGSSKWIQFDISDTGISTATDAKNYFIGLNPVILYELATPVTYQLTPTQVTTLLGQNNIFADCGDTAVIYRADTKLYIQKLTGSTEEDMIANANIPSGKYFLVGNNLYYSTSAIAQGAQIIVGTNCTATNLAEALNALNA